MKEKKLYTCEICHTDYAEKFACKQCEQNHKTNLAIKDEIIRKQICMMSESKNSGSYNEKR